MQPFDALPARPTSTGPTTSCFDTSSFPPTPTSSSPPARRRRVHRLLHRARRAPPADRAAELPKISAVSAFGTKLRFYASSIDPLPAASPSPTWAGWFADSVPQGRWNSDVLEAEGANLVTQAVAEIVARIYLNDGVCLTPGSGCLLTKNSIRVND
ncbi:hypothetical protein FB451DRAFT_1171421 [Mycena latifolia]|nr:hypothetical protein FB451DRAFT_1171421 [Mycena latifolia]